MRPFEKIIIDRAGAQTMPCLTCTISSVDLAHYEVSRAKRLGICGLWCKEKLAYEE